MEIEYFGANCFRIKTKETSIIVDDNLAALGAKSITKEKDVLLVTNKTIASAHAGQTARLVLDSAGEFEIGDISVKGVQTRAHMDEKGVQSATVFQCTYGGASVTILGHVNPELSENVQELAGGTDVLIVPVGGNGYTLDPSGAVSAIKTIEPDVVIPSHFATAGLNFEVPPAPLDDFLKASGLSAETTEDSLKVGKAVNESSQTQLVLLHMKKA